MPAGPVGWAWPPFPQAVFGRFSSARGGFVGPASRFRGAPQKPKHEMWTKVREMHDRSSPRRRKTGPAGPSPGRAQASSRQKARSRTLRCGLSGGRSCISRTFVHVAGKGFYRRLLSRVAAARKGSAAAGSLRLAGMPAFAAKAPAVSLRRSIRRRSIVAARGEARQERRGELSAQPFARRANAGEGCMWGGVTGFAGLRVCAQCRFHALGVRASRAWAVLKARPCIRVGTRLACPVRLVRGNPIQAALASRK